MNRVFIHDDFFSYDIEKSIFDIENSLDKLRLQDVMELRHYKRALFDLACKTDDLMLLINNI